MTLIKISGLVEKNYQHSSVKRQLDAEKICRICGEVIESLFNKEITSKLMEVISFKDGFLKIKCANSSVACELQQKSYFITEELNKKLEIEVVKKIIFVK